jgi:DNA (cytosine-5)-methyltransferase 1
VPPVIVGSICSGVGGLDLALGGEVAWHVENDPGANRVLAARWPGVPNYGDLKVVHWELATRVDVITAGWPCQPFSLAGKRKGAADDRHLWPFVVEALDELRPRWFIGENVRSHLSKGFGVVLDDLSGLGYRVRWGVVRASDAGAPHKRERVFLVAAHTDSLRSHRGGPRGAGRAQPAHRGDVAADPDSQRAQGSGAACWPAAQRPTPAAVGLPDVGPGGPGIDWGTYAAAVRRWELILGRPAPNPIEAGVRTARRLHAPFAEWMMGLPEGWVTGLGLNRTAELKAIGNAVMPQQARLALDLLGFLAPIQL